MQELTVKDLRIALIGVPDDLPVRLSSDTGVDQGIGEITVEKARRVKYGDEDYFEIYTNDHIEDDEEEDYSDEDVQRILSLHRKVEKVLKECREEL